MKLPIVTATPYDEELGPILVLAGPGTGKTYQIAKRIQFLLEEGADPSEITIITFTREAARSMQSKLAEKGKSEYVPVEVRPARISGQENNSLCAIADRMKALQRAYSEGLPEFLKSVTRTVKLWRSINAFYKEVQPDKTLKEADPGCYEVRILSLQKSKGLEANSVFVVGIEDGMLPRSATSSEEIAESARLLFVGMTRAKDHLHLMHSSTRSGAVTFTAKSHQLKPSRFLTSLPHATRKYHKRKS